MTMEMFSEDLNHNNNSGLTMLNTLYNRFFSNQKVHQILSKEQIKNLLRGERFKTGQTKVFGNTFMYSDSLGFYHSVQEIFVDECYRFLSPKKDPVIIDCGSNIGLSILYFKRLFPNAKIIGFEPDKEIFKLLTANVSNFELSNVQLYNKAVSVSNDPISFYIEGSLAGSTVIDFKGANKIQKIEAVRLKELLNVKIDFLKIDIEGAENELIFDLMPELENVEAIFIEYHSIPDKPQQLGELLNILKKAGFKYYIKEAANIMQYPFLDREEKKFDVQLNIFGYRL